MNLLKKIMNDWMKFRIILQRKEIDAFITNKFNNNK